MRSQDCQHEHGTPPTTAVASAVAQRLKANTLVQVLCKMCATVTVETLKRHWVVHPSHSPECNVFVRTSGNFFNFGTNVYLDSRMNWLDLGGQRSKAIGTACLLNVIYQRLIVGIPLMLAKRSLGLKEELI